MGGCCGSSEVKDTKVRPAPSGQSRNPTGAQRQPPPAPLEYAPRPAPVASGGGRRLGGQDSQPPPATEENRRARMAEAAMTRQTSNPGISDAAVKRMEGSQARDELLGKIRNLCDRLREEAPMGLPTCSVEQLRKHHEHLEGRWKNRNTR